MKSILNSFAPGLAAVAVALSVSASPAAGAPGPSPLGPEELRQRIDSLSRQVEELRQVQEDNLLEASESQSSVRAFLSDDLTFGGFFETGITELQGPDTRTQIAATSHTLGLNIAAEFQERWRFVAQFVTALSFPLRNINNNPEGTPPSRTVTGVMPVALPAQGYAEYLASDALHVQAGLGYVPFGVAFQQRELVLFVRRNGPQLLRTFDLVSPLWTGIHLYGSMPAEAFRAGYNLYTTTRFESPDRLGVGARLWWTSGREGLTAGLSSQFGEKGFDTYKALGLDLTLRFDPLEIVAEYARNFVEADDPWSAYVEPRLSLYRDILLVYAFADYGNSPDSRLTTAAGSVADPYRRLEYGAGLNWLPTANTRLRLGLFIFDYLGQTATLSGQDRDFAAIDLSAGVAF